MTCLKSHIEVRAGISSQICPVPEFMLGGKRLVENPGSSESKAHLCSVYSVRPDFKHGSRISNNVFFGKSITFLTLVSSFVRGG